MWTCRRWGTWDRLILVGESDWIPIKYIIYTTSFEFRNAAVNEATLSIWCAEDWTIYGSMVSQKQLWDGDRPLINIPNQDVSLHKGWALIPILHQLILMEMVPLDKADIYAIWCCDACVSRLSNQGCHSSHRKGYNRMIGPTNCILRHATNIVYVWE
jgi:hypothetical protein